MPYQICDLFRGNEANKTSFSKLIEKLEILKKPLRNFRFSSISHGVIPGFSLIRSVTLTILVMLLMVSGVNAGEVKSSVEVSPSSSTQKRIDSFTSYMQNWGHFYNDLAGTKNLYLVYDDQVEGDDLLIEGGDWAVFDERLCSGAYGVSHEDGSMFAIKLTKPDEHDLSCPDALTHSSVDALTLLRRYQWFEVLFMSWSHVLTPSPFSVEGWEEQQHITADYEKEKPTLASDPYLALYWLMHFGFTLDSRYDDVKSLIVKNKVAEDLDFINDAIAFFDHHSPSKDIPIRHSEADKSKFENLYLKRRSYLIYSVHSYSYASGSAGLENWWHSITLYPSAERHIIKRMRWLGNNLKKYEKWQSFNNLIGAESDVDSISLLSYVNAINPLLDMQTKQQYAEAFLKELIAGEQLWKDKTSRLFGQVMIWDVRELVRDKSLLAQASELYFKGDSISERFQDINAILNGDNANAVNLPANKLLVSLEEAVADFDQYKASQEQKDSINRFVDEQLGAAKAQSAEVLFLVIDNLKHEVLQKRALHYLYTHDIPSKEEVFINLYIRLELSSHEIPEIFADRFPAMMTDATDQNFELMKKVLLIPVEDYRNDLMAEYAQRAACMFFLETMHWTESFAFFMDVIKAEKYNDSAKLKDAIFTQLLSRDYDSKINPTLAMSEEQIETVLETISEILRKPQWLEHSFISEAIRVIYHMENSRAKSWIKVHHNDQAWLNTFPDAFIHHEFLRDSINEALEASLDSMSSWKAIFR